MLLIRRFPVHLLVYYYESSLLLQASVKLSVRRMKYVAHGILARRIVVDCGHIDRKSLSTGHTHSNGRNE